MAEGQRDILRVRVTLGERVYEEDLETHALINPDLDGLNTALAEHPGRFAWWATLEALARERHDSLGHDLEVLEAELFSRYQAELKAALPKDAKKDPTLDAIKAKITLDKRRLELAHELRESKRELDLVTVGRRTMEQKREALVAIASNLRAEMDYKIYTGKSRLATLQGPPATTPGPLTDARSTKEITAPTPTTPPPARTVPAWARRPGAQPK